MAEHLNDYFYVETSNDCMSTLVYCTDAFNDSKIELSESAINEFLHENQVVYGIVQDTIKLLASDFDKIDFPIIIAKGLPACHGIDGEINYALDFTTEYVKTSDWNFRDVMRIPSVAKGQRLATIVKPTTGQNGMDVYGNEIQAHPGTSVKMKAGQNVVYNEKDHSFYAASAGQVNVGERDIRIHEVYEVNETLSMKDGNLDFIGNIVIHGDVPTGYTLKAEGDIKVFGMVEAASLIAGGSICISEGFAGMQKGFVNASNNIHVGYINQGNVQAGNDLYVESSILHSNCMARNNVYCQKGNIIGGVLSVGKTIEARDIGNRMGTKTEIVFGLDKMKAEKEKQLLIKKKELQATLEKLTVIGEKLKTEHTQRNPKLRVTLLRQRNSYKQTSKKLAEIDQILEQIDKHISNEKQGALLIRDHLYSNVIVAFGKYKRKIDSPQQHIRLKLVENEITALPL